MSLNEEQHAQVAQAAHQLAREGNSVELADFIDHGLAVDVQDPDGNTLLMLAAYHSETETVRMLLEHGADANIQNTRGQTPIAGAIFKGADDIVKLLVAAGADLDAGTPSARQTAEMFGRGALLEQQ